MEKKDSPFKATKLWNQLIKSFVEGMELKRRRYRFKSYEDCFTGTDALEWMYRYLQHHPSYNGSVTKEQAFMLLQKFMENKVFECATTKAPALKFLDSNCLYRFNKENDSETSKSITIPSQKSITNLLNNVQQELADQKENIKSVAQDSTRTKTTAFFEASDEENYDNMANQNFFSRSNSLRMRKPLTSLTSHSTDKRKISTKRMTVSPLKRTSIDQIYLSNSKKRKVSNVEISSHRTARIPSKLFKSVSKSRKNKENEIGVDNIQMDISPIKTTYQSCQIMKHFSPSPVRRKLRKTRSDLNKMKSRSQHDLAYSQDGCGLYKANSSWNLTQIETSSKNQLALSKDRLSSNDLEETWKSVVLLSLRKMFKMAHVSEYIDQYQISGKDIMQNMECIENQVKDVLPEWLLSAMDCLVKWPNFDKSKVVGGLPSYNGFQRDVFHAIKEHYHALSNEPIIPCHLTSLLEECMEYLEENIELCIQVMQHLLLLLTNRKRCQLQMLVSFMKKTSENHLLHLSSDLTNKELMVHAFFRIISRKENHFLNTQTEVLGIRVAYFLMQNYDEVFTPPNGLRVQVDHKIAIVYGNLRHENTKQQENLRPSSAGSSRNKQNITFCQQITKQEYQKEALEFSRQEISNLLHSIMSDRSLSSKEMSKMLKQFQTAYPEIYESTVNGHRV